VRLTSSTHPGVRFDFERTDDLSWWPETGDPDDARIELVPDGGPDRSTCLRATNVNAGGLFRVPLALDGLDVRRAAKLSFDCRITAGARTNFYFTADNQPFFVHITGPDASNENLLRIADAGVKDDGAWHHVDIPLAGILAEHKPAAPNLLLENVFFGIAHDGYIRAGLGGNQAGAALWLDNIQIVSEHPGPVNLTLLDADGNPASGTPVEFSRLTGGGPRIKGRLGVSTEVPPGNYLVCAGPSTENSALPSLEVIVSEGPPAVLGTTPGQDTPWGGEPVVIALAPERLLPVWETTLKVQNGLYAVDGETLRWDRHRRTLTFDPARAEIRLNSERATTFALIVGPPETPPHASWILAYDAHSDTVPPGPVSVSQSLLDNTFERDLGAWEALPADKQGRKHGALLVRDQTEAAAGECSLKLFNQLVGGSAGATLRLAPFSAGAYPLLAMDCKMQNEAMMDLQLTAGGEACRITLTDNDHRNTARKLGSFEPAFAPDGAWHHMEVNLHELLAAAPYRPNRFRVTSMSLGDGGWTGNPEGACTWIDNVTLAPVISTAADGVTVNWTAHDPGGIQGYSFHWSDRATEDADTVVDSNLRETVVRNLPEGRQTLHVRAVDHAGNWGPTTHWKCLVDNTPPILAEQYPPPETVSASRCIRVRFEDPVSGVDPDTMGIAVNGRVFKPGQTGVSISAAQGELCLDWVEAGLAGNARTEGMTFHVQVPTVRDFAGNLSASADWKWTFATAEDTTAPDAPVITWQSGRTATHVSFESENPTLSVSAGAEDVHVRDPAAGSTVLRTTVTSDGGALTLVIPGAVDAQVCPFLSFRYRFPPGMMIDLVGRLGPADPTLYWMVVKLTDGDVRPDYTTLAGRVPGIRCDDRWHTAVVNVKKHLAVQQHLAPGQDPPSWTLKWLAFMDIGFNWNPVGTTFCLDDIRLFPPGPEKAAFQLKARDESGIEGYACCVDRNPEGTAPDSINVKDGQTFRAEMPEKGLWYVHAKAMDSAGNWSTTSHLPYVRE
jgi:hypothetical protein